ncbi:MAG: DUF1273 domain-containing protein [Clostridiales bacterium]|nr:DUF1273 domain-containing protein [Clostridiales bacterium]
MSVKSCAITGHRPTRFKFKYKENTAGCKRLKKRLRDQFVLLYEKGVHRFYVGGALGVDIWAGEILLRLKEQPEYKGIELMIALPFEGFDLNWDVRSKRRMDFLRQHSTEIIIIGIDGQNATENYRRKNQFMVDHADYLLAVYDNERSIRSETEMTVKYALKKNLSIICIHPDTGIVS